MWELNAGDEGIRLRGGELGEAEEEKDGKEGPSEERLGAWERREEAGQSSDKRQMESEASFPELST